MASACPICDSRLSEPPAATRGDATAFVCPQCGRFTLTGPLIATLPHLRSTDPDVSAKLSHVLRRATEAGDPVTLTSDVAEAILQHPLPRPSEQADLLLRWIAEHVPGPGEAIPIDSRTDSAVIGSRSPHGFKLVVDHLFDIGLVTGVRPGGAPYVAARATPSFAGWDRYENLKRGYAVYRKAFMAMKFGDPVLDGILERVFKPSVRQTGFELFKLDDAPRAGLIDDRLRVEVQSSDFVIADLTHANLGAYWEAGYAEGLGKPVIYTCERTRFETTKTHFDTNHHLTITWDESAPELAGDRLKATIRATLPHLARQQDSER
jgi:hypothetical protein